MNKEDIFAIVVRHAQEVVPGLENHQFQPTQSLKDLGANSIDRSEIVMMTLDTLSLKIPLIETVKATNIGELVSVLHAKL
jgi:polyketide biosynthesis acyl carrier protein